MKTVAALSLLLSTLIAGSAAQAQNRPLFVYSGSVGIEQPAGMLRGTTPAAVALGETAPARKVRVVLQSPYGS